MEFDCKFDFKDHSIYYHGIAVLCDHCGKTFKSSDDMYRHMGSSHDVYACEHCDDEFANKTTLKTHAELKHNVFACEYCEVEYTNKPRLDFHNENVHVEGSITNSCSVCGLDCYTCSCYWIFYEKMSDNK